jgi:hypothetical protein
LAAMRLPIVKAISPNLRFEKAPAPEVVTFPRALQAYQVLLSLCDAHIARDEDKFSILTAFARVDISERFASTRQMKTVLHCELQLADMFSRKGWRFVGGDPYIGCSKR